jgi:hypothetical protein
LQGAYAVNSPSGGYIYYIWPKSMNARVINHGCLGIGWDVVIFWWRWYRRC